MGYPIQISTSVQPLLFLMVLSDHVTKAIGKAGSMTVVISKNGGSFSTPLGALSEVGNGWYKIAGHVTDSNNGGPLVLHASCPGCDDTDETYHVVSYNPFDGVRLALTALPNAACNSNTSLVTVGQPPPWVPPLTLFRTTFSRSRGTGINGEPLEISANGESWDGDNMTTHPGRAVQQNSGVATAWLDNPGFTDLYQILVKLNFVGSTINDLGVGFRGAQGGQPASCYYASVRLDTAQLAIYNINAGGVASLVAGPVGFNTNFDINDDHWLWITVSGQTMTATLDARNPPAAAASVSFTSSTYQTNPAIGMIMNFFQSTSDQPSCFLSFEVMPYGNFTYSGPVAWHASPSNDPIHHSFILLNDATQISFANAPAGSLGAFLNNPKTIVSGYATQQDPAHLLFGAGQIIIEPAAGDAPDFDLPSTLRQILAGASGQTTGMNTTTLNGALLKNPGGTVDRATATLDGFGNRTVTAWVP